MRVLIAAALCTVLGGCVNDGLALEALQAEMRTGIEHDAHCRSLLMVPGTLVYIQCRLAQQQTLQATYERRRQQLLAASATLPPGGAMPAGGVLPEEVDLAIRDDAVCNLNASAENSMQPGEPEPLAFAAYEKCADSRERLRQAVLVWQPFDGERLLAGLQADAVAANQSTILEARALDAPVTLSAG